MKRSVTASKVLIVGFIALTASFNCASAQISSGPQTAQGTQNVAIPAPLNDVWKWLTDLGNQLQSKLPNYSIINDKTAGQQLEQGVKAVNYESVNSTLKGISTWYNDNVNLANMPGFIDKVTNIIKRAIELLALAIQKLVDYL
jgi:hypothetical protein